MTIKEFFESKENLAIHCDTEKKAKALLEAFDKAGYKWIDGIKYINETSWDDNREETCYSNKGRYCKKDWYQSNNYIILEFTSIEGSDLVRPDLSQYTTDELLAEIKKRGKK